MHLYRPAVSCCDGAHHTGAHFGTHAHTSPPLASRRVSALQADLSHPRSLQQSPKEPARFSAALPLSISVNTSTCQSAKTRPPYPKKLATPAFALYLARERREFHRGGRYWWAYRASISEYPALSENVESLSAFARLRSGAKIASNRPSANASEKARLLAA